MGRRSAWLPSARAAAAFLLGSFPVAYAGLWLAEPGSGENGAVWRAAVTLATALLVSGAPALLFGMLAQLWRHRVRLEGAGLAWSCAVPGVLLQAAGWIAWSARLAPGAIALVLGLGAVIAADLLPAIRPRRSPLPQHEGLASRMPSALPVSELTRAGASPRARRADEAAAYGFIVGYGLLAVLALDVLLAVLRVDGLDAMADFAGRGLLLGLPSFLVLGFAFATAAGLLFFVGDSLGAMLRPDAAPPLPYGVVSATLGIPLAWTLWPGADALADAAPWLPVLPVLSGLLGTLLAPPVRS